jgi:hypothetical protein
MASPLTGTTLISTLFDDAFLGRLRGKSTAALAPFLQQWKEETGTDTLSKAAQIAQLVIGVMDQSLRNLVSQRSENRVPDGRGMTLQVTGQETEHTGSDTVLLRRSITDRKKVSGQALRGPGLVVHEGSSLHYNLLSNNTNQVLMSDDFFTLGLTAPSPTQPYRLQFQDSKLITTRTELQLTLDLLLLRHYSVVEDSSRELSTAVVKFIAAAMHQYRKERVQDVVNRTAYDLPKKQEAVQLLMQEPVRAVQVRRQFPDIYREIFMPRTVEGWGLYGLLIANSDLRILAAETYLDILGKQGLERIFVLHASITTHIRPPAAQTPILPVPVIELSPSPPPPPARRPPPRFTPVPPVSPKRRPKGKEEEAEESDLERVKRENRKINRRLERQKEQLEALSRQKDDALTALMETERRRNKIASELSTCERELNESRSQSQLLREEGAEPLDFDDMNGAVDGLLARLEEGEHLLQKMIQLLDESAAETDFSPEERAVSQRLRNASAEGRKLKRELMTIKDLLLRSEIGLAPPPAPPPPTPSVTPTPSPERKSTQSMLKQLTSVSLRKRVEDVQQNIEQHTSSIQQLLQSVMESPKMKQLRGQVEEEEEEEEGEEQEWDF